MISIARGLAIVLGVFASLPAHAQRPSIRGSATAAPTSADTLRACYVPGSGTVYRVGAPHTPAACADGHREFRWASPGGAAGAEKTGGGVNQLDVVDHGSLAGLTDDDHPQYLLTQGVRQSINGFAVTGITGQGAIPASGPGTRFMWYPRKAALRAGTTVVAVWEDPQIGDFSTAFGLDVTASGNSSFAAGSNSRATGASSVALGGGAVASALYATAIGIGAVASGQFARALGYNVLANSYGATAIGAFASTNGKTGAFVYGDNNNSFVRASRDNQFVVRAQHFWLGRTNNVSNPLGQFITTSTGAYLSTGGTWTNSSDVNRKHAFRGVDGEAVLHELAAMPIRSWSYREEADSVRHLGPTAQDFRAAFGLGDTDKAIATVDADGVSLAAIQALERRTAAQALTLDALAKENSALRDELATVRSEVRRMRAGQ